MLSELQTVVRPCMLEASSDPVRRGSGKTWRLVDLWYISYTYRARSRCITSHTCHDEGSEPIFSGLNTVLVQSKGT